MGIAPMTQVTDRPAVTTRHAASEDADTRVARLYEAEIGRLTALGRLLTGDAGTGEDLAQEVFIDLLTELRKDPDYLQGSPWAWLRAAMAHQAAKRLRLAVREVQRRIRVYEERAWDEESWSDSTIDFERAVAQLPPRMRACVVLTYSEDMTIEQVAQTLGCGVRTVETQLRRARPRVAELLGWELPDRTAKRSEEDG
jgi:RNA polymerase sigma factor (sigma-70 family)